VGMRVERFSLFFPPLLVRKKIGETEYAIGAIPAGGYVKISGMSPAEDLPDEVRTRAYYSQPVWKRVVVIAAGPFVNLVIAFVVLLIFWGAIGQPVSNTTVGSIAKGFPAQGLLHKGDRLVAVDGKSGTPETLSRLISSHKCAQQPPTGGCLAKEPVHLRVNRDGRIIELTVRPKYNPALKRMLVGFSYGVDHHPESLGKAIGDSVSDFGYVAGQTASLPARILNSHERKQISGVVGVSDVAHETINTDPALAVRLLAIVSLSLAIVNLFPFLPLDGGHIFWAVVELFRRRPVPYSVMERAGVVGFMLVIALFFIGLTNDLGRINSGGF
jgi:regulator of sigma E protease